MVLDRPLIIRFCPAQILIQPVKTGAKQVVI